MKDRLLRLAVCALMALAAGANYAAAAMVLSLDPPDGATNLCPDTLLRITFDAPPVLNQAGLIRIRTWRAN